MEQVNFSSHGRARMVNENEVVVIKEYVLGEHYVMFPSGRGSNVTHEFAHGWGKFADGSVGVISRKALAQDREDTRVWDILEAASKGDFAELGYRLLFETIHAMNG